MFQPQSALTKCKLSKKKEKRKEAKPSKKARILFLFKTLSSACSVW